MGEEQFLQRDCPPPNADQSGTDSHRQIGDTAAMTALGLIQTSLCVSFLAATAIVLPIVHYQLYSHLRRQHRKAFDRLRISPSAYWFFWRDDGPADGSNVAYEQYFSSGNHQALKDRHLDALWRRVRLIRWACGLSFALLLITLLVYRADPNGAWAFLVDLARY
jgi:hypothetical protein